MIRNTHCTLCLSFNKRTINISTTDLQCVYENLANIKVRYETGWMCFICHEKLRQCRLLQLLAISTRGLIDTLCENNIDRKCDPLMDLSMTDTMFISILQPPKVQIKTEPDEETEYHLSDNELIINAVKPTIKEKETTNNYVEDEQPSSSCPNLNDRPVVRKDINTQQNKKELVLIIERLSPSIINKYVHKFQAKHNTEEYFEHREESPSAICTTKQIKQKLEDKICDKGTGHQDDLNISHNNEEQFRNNKQYTSDVCFKSFSCKSYLQRPIRIHTGDKPQSCDVCFKSFSGKYYLQQHIKIHTGYKPHSCEVCFKSFYRKTHLQQHIRIHTGDKLYSCDVCLKKFSFSSNLKRHIGIHTGDKPYSCDVCLKKFRQKETLIQHIRIHTGDKPYSCDVCLKKFRQKKTLIQHIRIHTGDKLYSCDVCLKKFSFSSNLKRHIGIHTGDKPYSCDVCLKKFRQKETLIQHIRIHTGDKPYSCDVCLKKFRQKGHLQQHIGIHTDNMTYSCDT